MCGFKDLLYKDGKLYRNGKEAGWLGNNGYRSLSVDDKKYLTHRVIWYLHYGTWPKVLDHINQNPLDNRIENLRECTQSTNLRNQRRIKGYHKFGRKYRAQASVNNKTKHIGTYDTAEEARAAYLSFISSEKE